MTGRHARTTLGELVASFRERGEAPAVVTYEDEAATAISYAELHTRVQRGVVLLREQGLGAGDTLVIWAPNSIAWITAYLACAELGVTVVPCDNQYSPRQIESVLEHSGAKLLLTSAEHLETLPSSGAGGQVARLVLDGESENGHTWASLLESTTADSAPSPPLEPETMASLLYTSGTTGTPKAVPLTHGNLMANVESLLAADLVDSDDRVLVPLPFHHTYPFTVGLLTVLGAGGTVVLPSGVSGPELVYALKDSKATVLLAVPRLCVALWDAIASQVMASGRFTQWLFRSLLRVSKGARRFLGLKLGKLFFGRLHRRMGPALGMLGCGGARLEPELAHNLEGLGWTVLTGYGLTETSPVLTFNTWRHRRLGSEGVPLPGVEIRIESDVPTEDGEILARGASVFAGYWNNPEATRAAFTDDGWFRTGDLGWLDDDGFLHIAGRNKEVIVLPDGKNVYPEEVEAVYAESELIKDIAVLEHGGTLVGLVVADLDAVRARGGLRLKQLVEEELERISAQLPRSQRLTDYRITRSSLPRTTLGKLKRHELPELYQGDAERERDAAPAPLSDEDRALIESGLTREVWKWLEARYPDHGLSLDSSPQLDLQIDSLQWVSLSLELERQFQVALDSEALTRVLTIRDLLREIERAPAGGERSAERPKAVLRLPSAGPFSRALGRVLLGINRQLLKRAFHLEVIGEAHLPSVPQSIVITPNHVSYMDPLAIAAALPAERLRDTYWPGWVGKMYSGPVHRLISRATNVFPVDPDRDPDAAVDMGRQILSRDQSLVWFPEGRRSPTGDLQHFLSGIGGLLDGIPDVPLIPAAIVGAREAWPIGQRLPSFGSAVTVIFGAPVSTEQMKADGSGASDRERIADGLHRQVAALLARHHAETR